MVLSCGSYPERALIWEKVLFFVKLTIAFASEVNFLAGLIPMRYTLVFVTGLAGTPSSVIFGKTIL